MVEITLSSGKMVCSEKRFVKEVLKELGLLENTVLVTRGDELLTPDVVLKKKDQIQIISVVSGG